MTELRADDPAPDFDLPAIGGGRVRLSEREGPVVLFFFPKAMTSG